MEGDLCDLGTAQGFLEVCRHFFVFFKKFFGMALLTPQGSTTGPKGTEYPTQSEDRPTIQI